ncbi:hypothetical protein J4442_00775 [Candidatus Woesearchaeota archaeon]|nr:hypothetical protein [Candidatus Woesearchaeota archaeon]
MNIELMKQSQLKCKERANENHIRKLNEKAFGVNERLQYVRISNRKLNCLRWHNNETREHIIKKLDICRWLKEIEHEFITEAIFVNGSRADIIDLTDGIIYEILVSEEEKRFNEKIKNYPDIFVIVKA